MHNSFWGQNRVAHAIASGVCAASTGTVQGTEEALLCGIPVFVHNSPQPLKANNKTGCTLSTAAAG